MKFGQYELLEPIAIGGMAEVFKGRVVGAEGFEKFVAIKRILPDLVEDERFVKMLLTEARIHSALSHRNIVQIHDLGISEGGEYFIVLEFVEGYDLRVITDQLGAQGEIIPEALSLHIAAEIAQGLHFAHELRGPEGKPLGLVHRDVTPSNVLISFAGEVKLSDFGLAKRTHDRSLVGSLKGNLAYMSPEQAMQAALDRRTDVYSLGAVLFELLTGRRLREITNEIAGWSQVASGVVPSVAALRPDLPPPVVKLLDTALAADPAKRFPDAAAFGTAIRDALSQMNIAVGASDLAALLGLVKPPRKARTLTTERSKVIRLGPDAAALREAAAAPATPAPQLRDPITTVGVGPPSRLTPAAGRSTLAAAGGPRPTPANRPVVREPVVSRPSAREPFPTTANRPAPRELFTAPAPAPASRPAPREPLPVPAGRSGGRERFPTPVSRLADRGPAPSLDGVGREPPTPARPAIRTPDPAATPAATPKPPAAVTPRPRTAAPARDPDATPPPSKPLPPARNRSTPQPIAPQSRAIGSGPIVSQPRVTPSVPIASQQRPSGSVPVVPQPELVSTPAYGVDRPPAKVFEISLPQGAPGQGFALPPEPPPGYGPGAPPRANPPPGSPGRRPSAGFQAPSAFGPLPEPMPARTRETARIQIRQRRSWGGVLATLVLLVVGAAVAVHLLFVRLDVLVTWREPAALSIATDPRGATVRLDGVELNGTAPMTISVRRDRSDHIIEASLPGYRTARSILRYDQSVGLSSQLRLERQPDTAPAAPSTAGAPPSPASPSP